MTARGLLWLLGLWLCAAGVARAHTFVPTVISLHEVVPGRFVLDLVPPPGVPLAESARLRYPGHCQLQLEPSPQAERVSGVLDCGSLGLRGQPLALWDVSHGEAMVSIQFLNGEPLSALLHKDPLHIPVPAVATQRTARETLTRFAPCDLVLVEGFKREAIPKLEIWRAALGKPLLFPTDPTVIALASDDALPAVIAEPTIARLGLSEIGAIATFALERATAVE